MLNVDAQTLAALQAADTAGLIEADFLVWWVKDYSGNSKPFAFWTDHDVITGTVISPFTGLPETHDFVGGGAVIDVGDIPRTSNLDVVYVSVVLSAVHPVVLDMWAAHDMRLAGVEIHRGLFDPATRNLISTQLDFVGEVDGAPKDVPTAGGEGGLRFRLVPDSEQLTIYNPAKRSDAHQRTRNGDGFHRYIGVAGDWTIPWGQETE